MRKHAAPPHVTWSLSLLVLALGSTGLCSASNAITPGKLIAEPTFESVGIELRYTGDANFNANARLMYRTAGKDKWSEGHPFLRISDRPMSPGGKGAKNARFATSILFLKEATSYEIKAIVEDPDGVEKQPGPVRISTKDSNVKTGGGKALYVDTKAGPGGDGSTSKPFNSLQKGLSAGGPGDTVHFLPGMYHFSGRLTTKASGKSDAYLHLKAHPGATLSDADPAISGVGKVKWAKHKQDVDGRWIYKADLKGVTRVAVRRKPGDPSSSYLLWKFHPEARGPHCGKSLEHMLADIPRKNHLGAFLQDKETLYITLPDGFEPASADLQIARKDRSEILFQGHHVLVDGFTVELSAALRVQPKLPSGHFVFRRLKVYSIRHGGSHDTVINVGLHGLLEDSAFILHSYWAWNTTGPARDGEWVKKKKHRWGDIRRTWFQTKSGYNDSYAANAGSHSVLRYNLFSGNANALHVRNKGRPSEHKNIDIHNNLVENIADDAFEPEGPAVNMRIYENKVMRFLNGISDAPCSVGPVFVVRNILHGFIQGAFKCKNGAAGQALYYHNACYPNLKDVRPCGNHPDGTIACRPSPHDGVRWMRTRNNVIVARSAPMHLNRSRFPAAMINSLDYDYNVLWALSGKRNPTMLKEPHSVWRQPAFKDVEAGDLRLSDEKQPGVDAGDVIKGINDEVPERYQYKGKAPDMGLYEVGVKLPHYGPRPEARGD